MTDIELYDLHGCPYCAKVRRALDDLDLAYETRSASGTRRNREGVYEVSGRYGVPVLVDESNGVEGMAESDDIFAYLYRQYGDEDEQLPECRGCCRSSPDGIGRRRPSVSWDHASGTGTGPPEPRGARRPVAVGYQVSPS